MQPGVLRRPRSQISGRRYVLAFAGSIVLLVLNWSSFSDLLFKATKSVAPVGKQKESEGLEPSNQLLKLVNEDVGFTTSAAHCSLSTMNDKAWEGAMCSFKNLCYDPKAQEFIFFRGIPEMAPPPHPLNLGKLTKFNPKVVDGKLPVPRYEASLADTWIIMEMNDQSRQKLEDFLRDDLFAWWLLAQHTTWADQPTIVRPLASLTSPELTSDMLEWYKAMPFAPLMNVKELSDYDKPICFPKSVAGLGSMTDHCFAPDHDWHELKKPKMGVGVEAIPCATGRGPLFYRMREEMIARLSGQSDVSIGEIKRKKSDQHVILFAEKSGGHEFESFEAIARKQFPEALIQRECVSCLSPRDQMLLALTVSVYITRPTGPQSLAAHFLRRGAGVVLLEEPPYHHTNFGLWNNLAYVRARWVQKEDALMESIKIELEKADSFL